MMALAQRIDGQRGPVVLQMQEPIVPPLWEGRAIIPQVQQTVGRIRRLSRSAAFCNGVTAHRSAQEKPL